jgi:hypothetical protein
MVNMHGFRTDDGALVANDARLTTMPARNVPGAMSSVESSAGRAQSSQLREVIPDTGKKMHDRSPPSASVKKEEKKMRLKFDGINLTDPPRIGKKVTLDEITDDFKRSTADGQGYYNVRPKITKSGSGFAAGRISWNGTSYGTIFSDKTDARKHLVTTINSEIDRERETWVNYTAREKLGNWAYHHIVSPLTAKYGHMKKLISGDKDRFTPLLDRMADFHMSLSGYRDSLTADYNNLKRYMKNVVKETDQKHFENIDNAYNAAQQIAK